MTDQVLLNGSRAPAPVQGGALPEERDPIIVFALRWWWLLLLGVCLGVAGAVGYSRYGPVPYASTALVQVQAQPGDDPTANAAQERSAAANYAAEAASSRVFTLVSQALAGKLAVTPSQLQRMSQSGALSIKQARGANFVTITVSDRDPERAKLLADTFASVFVADVNARAKQQFDERQQQLQQQIDFTRDRLATAALFQRKQDLEKEIRDQRGSLLTLQINYQQLLQSPDPASPGGEDTSPRASARQALSQQIREIQANISDLEAELASVQQAIGKLPPDASDPSLSAALATAYAMQLSALTEQYVSRQTAAITADPPLVRYGDASPPLPTQGIKKLLVFGLAAGGGLAVALGYGIDLLRRRRLGPAPVTSSDPVRVHDSQVLRPLGQGFQHPPTLNGHDQAPTEVPAAPGTAPATRQRAEAQGEQGR